MSSWIKAINEKFSVLFDKKSMQKLVNGQIMPKDMTIEEIQRDLESKTENFLEQHKFLEEKIYFPPEIYRETAQRIKERYGKHELSDTNLLRNYSEYFFRLDTYIIEDLIDKLNRDGYFTLIDLYVLPMYQKKIDFLNVVSQFKFTLPIVLETFYLPEKTLVNIPLDTLQKIKMLQPEENTIYKSVLPFHNFLCERATKFTNKEFQGISLPESLFLYKIPGEDINIADRSLYQPYINTINSKFINEEQIQLKTLYENFEGIQKGIQSFVNILNNEIMNTINWLLKNVITTYMLKEEIISRQFKAYKKHDFYQICNFLYNLETYFISNPFFILSEITNIFGLNSNSGIKKTYQDLGETYNHDINYHQIPYINDHGRNILLAQAAYYMQEIFAGYYWLMLIASQEEFHSKIKNIKYEKKILNKTLQNIVYSGFLYKMQNELSIFCNYWLNNHKMLVWFNSEHIDITKHFKNIDYRLTHKNMLNNSDVYKQLYDVVNEANKNIGLDLENNTIILTNNFKKE